VLTTFQYNFVQYTWFYCLNSYLALGLQKYSVEWQEIAWQWKGLHIDGGILETWLRAAKLKYVMRRQEGGGDFPHLPLTFDLQWCVCFWSSAACCMVIYGDCYGHIWWLLWSYMVTVLPWLWLNKPDFSNRCQETPFEFIQKDVSMATIDTFDHITSS